MNKPLVMEQVPFTLPDDNYRSLKHPFVCLNIQE